MFSSFLNPKVDVLTVTVGCRVLKKKNTLHLARLNHVTIEAQFFPLYSLPFAVMLELFHSTLLLSRVMTLGTELSH